MYIYIYIYIYEKQENVENQIVMFRFWCGVIEQQMSL